MCRTLPTTVQFPGDAHEIEETDISEKPKTPFGNSAGRAWPQPSFGGAEDCFTEVAVNASLPPSVFGKSPRAVQFSGVGHDTELKLA